VGRVRKGLIGLGWGVGRGTYCGDGLHAEDEGVGCQITGVGEGVFFPELAEEVLG